MFVIVLGVLFARVVNTSGDLLQMENVVKEQIGKEEIRFSEINEDRTMSDGNTNTDLQHDIPGHSSDLDNVINELENESDKLEIDEVLSDVLITTSFPSVIMSDSYAKVKVANNVTQNVDEGNSSSVGSDTKSGNVTKTQTEILGNQEALIQKSDIDDIDIDTNDGIIDVPLSTVKYDQNEVIKSHHNKANQIQSKESEQRLISLSKGPYLYPKCCPLGSVLYLPPAAPPGCETLQHYSLPVIRPPTNITTTAEETWEVGMVKGLKCESSEIPLIVSHQDFMLLSTTSLTTTLLYLSSVNQISQDFCIDFGIQDGEELQLFAQGCLDRERLCSANTCFSTCDNIASVSETKDEVVVNVPNKLECEHEEKEVNMKNGSVFFIEEKLGMDSYCLLNKEGSKYSTMTSLVCKNIIRTDKHLPLFKIELMKYLYLVSVVSLKVTLLLHIIVPELRSSLFGWMKISHLTSMLLTFLLMAITSFSGVTLILDFKTICTIIGFATHYFFLSSFFWLNIMSFDIWRTFRNMTGYGSMMNRMHGKRKRFIYYSMYAWGVPLIFSIFTIIIEFLPDSYKQDLIIPDPGHGQRSCFFQNYAAKMTYLHIPVMVLLTLNILFFLLASWSLVFGIWSSSADNRIKQPTKQKFTIVVWLFFGMGLPWVADSITGAVGNTEHVLVFILDILNALNGLVIFVIFMMKKSVINSIRRFVRGIPQPTEFANSLRKTMSTMSTTGSTVTSMSFYSSRKSLSETLSTQEYKSNISKSVSSNI